jgi:hypothetical protein
MILAAADAAEATAPWWGSGLFGLLGAVLVAFLAQLFNRYNESRKGAAEQSKQEQTMRREALTTYLSAASQYLANSGDAAAQAALWHTFYATQFILPLDIASEVRSYHSTVAEAKSPSETGRENEVKTQNLIDSQQRLVDEVRDNPDLFGLPKPTAAERKAAETRSRPVDYGELYRQAQRHDPDLR